MRTFATVAAFAASANALVGRDSSCCFHLSAEGGVSGTIGQLDDGQNRVFGDLSEAQFCIDSSGAITDADGRGCIVTDDTTQFQCDEGATPMPGFSIDSNGQLSYQGDQEFVACQTGLNGGMNLYTTESDKVTECQDITLMADGCSGSSSGSSSVPVPSSTPVAGSSTPVVPPTVPSSSVPTVPEVPAGSSSVPTVPEGPTGSSSVPAVPSVPAGSSSVPGPPQEQTTVRTTMTTTYCPESSSTVPVIPVTTPEVPATPVPSQPAGSETPSQPAGSETPSSPAGSGTPSSPPSSETPQPSGTQSSSGSCPTDLSGDYEYPHLIIPVDSSKPDNAPGTSFNGTITSTVSSIFNFDIPSSDAGKTCSLVFLFPELQDLETSSYSFSGDGKIDFSSLESAATASTSYNNAPGVKEDLGEFTVSPGNSYLISTFSCPAGEAVSYEMKNAGSTELNFFEDYNPSPLGLYITVC